MAIEGIHNPFAAGFNATAAAHGTEGPHGLFMGHAVKVEATPEKLLADAAEEIGFALDKTQDYEISRRKERNAARISEEVLARYRAHLEEAGKSEAMHSTIESLKHAADAKSFRQALEEAFPDPADAWAVLEAAREAFAEDPAVSNVQTATLERVREEFFAQNRRDIALGMRGAVTGLDFGDLDGASALGSLYRDTVGEFTDVNEVYSDISARYGEKFDKAMDFLFAAISADIESASPSLEITQLESVHRKLGEVRLTRSAHILCTEVLNRWKDVHGGVTTLTPMSLLGEIVALRRQPFVGANQIDDIARKANPVDIEHEVLFLQEFFRAVRDLPVEFFPDDVHRRQLVDAVQTSLDGAIEREDEWLASQE